MRAPHTIVLDQTDDGAFIVRAGCKTLVYMSLPTLLDALRDYYTDPVGVVAALSRIHGWGPPAPAPQIPAPPGWAQNGFGPAVAAIGR